MAETIASIAQWAEETFGSGTVELAIARAGQELAELAWAQASGAPAAARLAEAADVAICLATVARRAFWGESIPPRPSKNGFSPRYHLARAQLHFGKLAGYGVVIQQGEARRHLSEALRALADYCDALDGDLQEAVDAKMAINRSRRWILTADGHGRHA